MIETKEEYKLVKDLDHFFSGIIKFVNEKDFVLGVRAFFKKLLDEYENEAVLISCSCGENKGVRIDNSGAFGLIRCVACGERMAFRTKGNNLTINVLKEENENENTNKKK